MKKYNIILLLLLVLSTILSAQNPVIDTNTIHGLRELGKGVGSAYEETNHTGIKNEEFAQLDKAATDLKAVIPETVAPGFKVFDYGSYPILKFMNKENFTDELFAAMEAEVKKTTSNYLLIGKHIDPNTGKVEFKVKLSLPVTGNKGGNANQWSILNDNVIGNITSALINEAQPFNQVKDNSKGQEKILLKLLSIFKKIDEGKYGPYYCFTPSGHIIKFSFDSWFVDPQIKNGSIYGWEDSNIRYMADIRADGKFYGYKYEKDNKIEYFTGEDDDFKEVKELVFLSYLPKNCTYNKYIIPKVNLSNFEPLKKVVNENNKIENGAVVVDQSSLIGSITVSDGGAVLNCQLTTQEAKSLYDDNHAKIVAADDKKAEDMFKVICQTLGNMDEDLRSDFLNMNNRQYHKHSEPTLYKHLEKTQRTFDNLYAYWVKINTFSNAYQQLLNKIDAQLCTNATSNATNCCNNTSAREEIIQLIQTYFVDDYYAKDWTPASMPTGKTLMVGPFKQLNLAQRVCLFKLMVSGTMGGAWTNGGNKGPEDIAMMAIINTPEKDKENLLAKIDDVSTIKMIKEMDELNAWQLVVTADFINNIIVQKHKYTKIPDELVTFTPVKKEFLIHFDKADTKSYIFKDNNTKINISFYYSDDTGTDVSFDQTYSPFDIVTVKFLGDCTIGGVFYRKNSLNKMTVMAFCVLLNTKFEDGIKKAAEIGLEGILLLTFAGEVRLAIEAGNWLKAAAYASDIGITLGDNVMQAKLKDPNWLAQPENKAFTESYLDCSSAWFLFRTPYWVGDALNGLAKIQLFEAEKGLIKARLLALTEDIEIVTEGLKSRLLQRIGAEPTNFTWFYNDLELKMLVTTAKNLKVEAQTIEDMLYIACRNDKPIASAILNEQFADLIAVLERKFPYRFNNLGQFQSFQKDIRIQLDALINSKYSVKIQGSSVRYRFANDVDVAVEVTEAEFRNILVSRYDKRAALSDGTQLTLVNKTDLELTNIAEIINLNPSMYNTQAKDFSRAMRIGKFDSKSGSNIFPKLHEDVTKKILLTYPNTNISNISIQRVNATFDLLPIIKF